MPGAVLQDGHQSRRNRAEKSNKYERRPQVFQQGREAKETDTAFIAREEADKKDCAMRY